MTQIDEDRVYAGGRREATLLVATESGLVSASVTGDRVGRFGIAWHGSVLDVCADGDRVVIATPDGVKAGSEPTTLDSTEIDSATTVGLTDDGWVVGDSGGRVHLVEGDQTRLLGHVGPINAIAPPLIATDDGLYRLPTLDDGGLSAVRDVTTDPIPLAATPDGLFKLGNGWIAAVNGDGSLVSGASTGAAVAIVDGILYTLSDGDWRPLDPPTTASIADVGVGPALYAVTVGGKVLVEAGAGWRHRNLGISPVRRLAVRRESR
jgi:hypothetical protein